MVICDPSGVTFTQMQLTEFQLVAFFISVSVSFLSPYEEMFDGVSQ